jgi:hypothetical protein
LSDTTIRQDILTVHGHCPICEKPQTFRARYDWLRDHFLCDGCGSIPRERALMHVIQMLYPKWRSLSIHESSPGGRGASTKLAHEAAVYTPSHFDAHLALGASHSTDGWQNENLECQTFSDARFDLVITQDVLEHLFDPEAAFREIARTLRPGGAHIFTVPLVQGRTKASTRRATRTSSGAIEHTTDPEYHGNPIDESGSLVTMDWGYDIVDHIRHSCALDTEIYALDILHMGIRAELLEVLVTRKPALA